MGARIFWRFASDAGTITANSTASGFPARNVQRSALSLKHKSDGSQATDMWTVDLGSALDVSALFVGGHDFSSGDTLTFRYASDSGFTADTGTVSVTYRADNLYQFFTAISRRYWRLENLKDVAAETRQIGRLALGDHTELGLSLRLGYGVGAAQDTSKIVVTEGGQAYADIGVALRALRGDLIVAPAEKAELEALRVAYQTAVPFVLAADYETYPVTKSLYGRLQSLPVPVDVAADLWRYSWDMIEQK